MLDRFDATLSEQAKKKFLRSVTAAQTEIIFALIRTESILSQLNIVRAVPINSFSGSADSVKEGNNLFAFVVSPR